MADEFRADIEAVEAIDAIPTILDVVCRTTGMGFAAVARVTERALGRLRASAMKSTSGFEPGGELKVETTICHEIRQSAKPSSSTSSPRTTSYCGHPTPAMYGFQSYISMPIILADGRFFGTLCAIDPRPPG